VGQYAWLVRSTSIRQLLTAWGLSYAGDLAAFTAASVYAYHAGGAGLVAVLGLLKALPGVLLVPLVTSGSDRLRRERLLVATAVPRALLLAAAAAAMGGGGEGVLVVVFVGLEGGLASAFRQLQAALLPWLAHTPEELTGANTVTSVLQSAAMVAGPAVAACLLAVGTAQQAMLLRVRRSGGGAAGLGAAALGGVGGVAGLVRPVGSVGRVGAAVLARSGGRL